jgi:hypothetical protein
MIVDRNPRNPGGNCPQSWLPPAGPHQPSRQPLGERAGAADGSSGVKILAIRGATTPDHAIGSKRLASLRFGSGRRVLM